METVHDNVRQTYLRKKKAYLGEIHVYFCKGFKKI